MTDYTYESSPFIKISSPSEHVLLIELQRKPVNAFNEAFWTEFGTLFDKVGKDGAVRAVVLASALPKIFTAGLDLTDTGVLQSSDPSDPARKALALRAYALQFQSAISSLSRCPQPIIAALHGLVLGLGVDIACACDVRYSSSDATFCIKEVDVGLAADIGTLARLPKISGNESMLHELALTARMFGAEEARELGLISKVVPAPGGAEGRGKDFVVEAALETAKIITQKSPVAVIGTKRFLAHARDHSVEDTLEYEATWNAFALQATDLRDSFAAFKSKKPPKYRNLPKL